VISSFAAREVLVSAISVIHGIGEDAGEDPQGLVNSLRGQKRADGKPVFSRATCFSLMVFYVLAMQCLPTQAVTRRETGSWKWAIFQFVYMTILAYVSALIVYQTLTRLGIA
jgi:ferrous iron transport protein B